jgi:hypothetical protein
MRPTKAGVDCLAGQSAAASAGDAARTKAIDGQRHIPPRAQPIGDFHRMAGDAAAAMKYKDRRMGPLLEESQAGGDRQVFGHEGAAAPRRCRAPRPRAAIAGFAYLYRL